MKHTISAMKLISGNADNDRAIADEFCSESKAESKNRLETIKNIAFLGSILDRTQLDVAADARAGIRHIYAGVIDVQTFHQKGNLAPQLNDAVAKIEKMLDEANGLYRWLHELYTQK
ncbi:hypothetical protein ACTOWA_00335 [Herbaspirillum seropedicae]|uniref:hypothetical protein n=1 Tax=Herbaspirillum seropedicae TaxID=964 RepID=UPI00285BD511|nr:hypothetical protein [Herbaspirillum seropedicae]MDR6397963.1 hypothetical protein [Herbaspirillum seropedicae]